MQTNGSTTAVTIDTAQNVGVGVTPSAWNTSYKALEFPNGTGVMAYSGGSNIPDFHIFENAYLNNSSNWVYKNSGYKASRIDFNNGSVSFAQSTDATQTAGSTITFTQAMTLNNSSQLSINTTSVFQSSQLSVSGSGNVADFRTSSASGYPIVCENTASGSTNMIVFLSGSSFTTVGSITYNGTLTVYGTTSDRRLKSNITDLTTADSGLLIDSLLPRKFNWTNSGQADVGFIADEVQKILPSAVTGTENGTKEEEYEVTPAVKDEQGNITTPAVMGTRTIPDYQMVDMSIPEMMAHLIAEVKSLRARLKAANIA